MMKKIGIVWLLMLTLLMAGCSTSVQEFEGNLNQVMMENEKRDYNKGSVDDLDPSLIRWKEQEYILSDRQTVPDEVVGDITKTVLLDETTGDLIPESEWGRADPHDVLKQKRKLLQYGMIYSIPNQDTSLSIAVEINNQTYQADAN